MRHKQSREKVVEKLPQFKKSFIFSLHFAIWIHRFDYFALTFFYGLNKTNFAIPVFS